MEILPFLVLPFIASLILTGIHSYLGVHVVERGVIFVDLALAQIAALGATVAVVVSMDPHGRAAYWISLRSEEHTSELQSLAYLVCRLLLEKKKIMIVTSD